MICEFVILIPYALHNQNMIQKVVCVTTFCYLVLAVAVDASFPKRVRAERSGTRAYVVRMAMVHRSVKESALSGGSRRHDQRCSNFGISKLTSLYLFTCDLI